MPIGAGLGIAGLASAGASLYGSSQQSNAAQQAANLQQQQYQQTRSDLLPYNQAGQNATNALMTALTTLTAPINMNESTLRQTPGYQFSLNQGLKSVQNSAAARGLGTSGAALKGAAGYATGLADSTYQQQFQNALTNKQNTFNMLSGVAGLGENAAARTGTIGQQMAANAGNALIASGTAQSAGINGAANALTGAYGSYLGYTNPLLGWGATSQAPSLGMSFYGQPGRAFGG
jgi:hypothetical protein